MNPVLASMRICSDWLQDGTNGVNAKIDAITLDGSDTVPPDVVTIIEASSSDALAASELPQESTDYPVLGVTQHNPFTGRGEIPGAALKDFTGEIAIWYLTKGATRKAALEDYFYTMDAVMASLTELAKDENQASRTRESVTGILTMDEFSLLPAFTVIDDVVVSGGVAVSMTVRDLEP